MCTSGILISSRKYESRTIGFTDGPWTHRRVQGAVHKPQTELRLLRADVCTAAACLRRVVLDQTNNKNKLQWKEVFATSRCFCGLRSFWKEESEVSISWHLPSQRGKKLGYCWNNKMHRERGSEKKLTLRVQMNEPLPPRYALRSSNRACSHRKVIFFRSVFSLWLSDLHIAPIVVLNGANPVQFENEPAALALSLATKARQIKAPVARSGSLRARRAACILKFPSNWDAEVELYSGE